MCDFSCSWIIRHLVASLLTSLTTCLVAQWSLLQHHKSTNCLHQLRLLLLSFCLIALKREIASRAFVSQTWNGIKLAHRCVIHNHSSTVICNHLAARESSVGSSDYLLHNLSSHRLREQRSPLPAEPYRHFYCRFASAKKLSPNLKKSIIG